MKKFLGLLIFVLLMNLSVKAGAVPISTINFTGSFNYNGSLSKVFNIVNAKVNDGSILNNYDLTINGLVLADPLSYFSPFPGYYIYNLDTTSSSLEISSSGLSVFSSNINIASAFVVGASANFSPFIEISLTNINTNPLALGLPSDTFDLYTSPDTGDITMTFQVGSNNLHDIILANGSASGSMSGSISPLANNATVPEPTTVVLVLTGFCFIGLTRKLSGSSVA